VTGNTTSAINKLRRKLAFDIEQGDEVFLSEFEHSSNDLPWRVWNPTRVPADADGLIDLTALDDLLSKRRQQGRAGRLLVALAGASNLTGGLAPLAKAARISHRHGGLLFVDAAQLVGHRGVSMRGTGSGDHIDFMAFSGHKMYAPFGAGVLIGRTSILAATEPDDVGGGTVDFVTLANYDLTPDVFRRENPGTPNAAGLVAMAVAGRMLKQTIGFDAIADHEQELLEAAQERWQRIPQLKVLGELEYSAARKCAILSFVLAGHDHALVAARLSHEFGVGVRHGHLCQFPFVARLLGLSEREVGEVREKVLSGEKSAMYGVVRASFGMGNTPDEVVRIGDVLEEIAATPERSSLYLRQPDGNWQPKKLPPSGAAGFFNIREQ
jgi:selenocysteine lyase/cysteine desulfurase